MDSLGNVDTIKEEVEEDTFDHDNEVENPYWNIIINDFERINVNVNTSQIEQWSILSNVINYVQYNRNPSDHNKLDAKALELKNHRKIYDRLKEEATQVIELDFVDTPGKLKGEYLDTYDGVNKKYYVPQSLVRIQI